MDLFASQQRVSEKQTAIEGTIDAIRSRYGKGVIRFGHFQDDETGLR